MKKILLLLLLTIYIFASNIKNPNVYAALGDLLYDNIYKIEKLQGIATLSSYKSAIKSYKQELLQLKKQGFAIESGDKTIDKRGYLDRLRVLSKKNDYFIRKARSAFDKALLNEDTKTFEQLIRTGLIDITKNKEKIIEYYFAHQEDINPSGVIQSYLDEDTKLRIKQEKKQKFYKTKKELELEKIRRIRKNDKIKQAQLEKRLDAEVTKKKREIQEEQKKQLFN